MTAGRLSAIDPPGCGCADCLTGEAVPLFAATAEQIRAMIAGDLTDRTGGGWTVTRQATFGYEGTPLRSWDEGPTTTPEA